MNTLTAPTQKTPTAPQHFVPGYVMHYGIGGMTITRRILRRRGMTLLSEVTTRAGLPVEDTAFEVARLSVRTSLPSGEACAPYERFPIYETGPDCAHRNEFPYVGAHPGSREKARREAIADFESGD